MFLKLLLDQFPVSYHLFIWLWLGFLLRSLVLMSILPPQFAGCQHLQIKLLLISLVIAPVCFSCLWATQMHQWVVPLPYPPLPTLKWKHFAQWSLKSGVSSHQTHLCSHTDNSIFPSTSLRTWAPQPGCQCSQGTLLPSASSHWIPGVFSSSQVLPCLSLQLYQVSHPKTCNWGKQSLLIYLP